MNNIFEETVKTLTKDAQALQKKVSEYQSKNDFRGALDSMRLLKDTLSLIKEYDWQLMYSEYGYDNDKKVAVWEQNHCGEIRNHKVWNVNKNIMYIDYFEKRALVFFDGKRYVLNYFTSENNERNQLIDFIDLYGNNCEIYIDANGFGLVIADVLKSHGINYKRICNQNFSC